MPTDWLPWPGKMKAIVVIARDRRRAGGEPGESACTLAGIRRSDLRSGGEDRPVTDLLDRPPAPADTVRADPAPADATAARAAPADPRARERRPATSRRRPRASDPAAGPDLPEALARGRRRGASSRTIARVFEADLSAPVVAAGTRIQNVRQITERVAMGRALWRELVIGFASQLGELNLGFTQLAALYVLAEGATTTIADLADSIGRSPSATSRLVDGLVRRRLVERRRDDDDRRQRSVWLTARGRAVLRMVDRARAEQVLAAVRPLPRSERALIAMGVAALATHGISRRGRLVRPG
jgi:DNA-binding MarR family transcriptional regulator